MASNRALLYSLLLISLFLSFTEAREFLIGGKTNAWIIPASDSESLNKWAEGSRFQIGDSLVWNYDPSKDSVLQVSEKDYESCSTSSPIAIYKDGSSKVKLDRSGPFYFISGVEGHCEKGQKLATVVLSVRRRFSDVSPAPSPVESEGPAVAPTSDGTRLRGGLGVLGVLGMLVVF
ncbi:early nodulin-like protein 1 [Juglans microcarpa x Juglans regia]|uniref:early nodulin-like protein 1 n=1 Tax=Juglans microcarpa x Juglans regia TaxID=2249226 RepID=UPI001B7DC4B0|nr:early nodulin-like protein 1 [Juglans microcarpa x Juglans regia]